MADLFTPSMCNDDDHCSENLENGVRDEAADKGAASSTSFAREMKAADDSTRGQCAIEHENNEAG